MINFINIVCRYFFWFILYSFGGWIMETLLYVIRDKKVVKRGFLFGPVCPIYGTAAVLCSAFLYGKINNIALLFVLGFFLSGVLEYLTHFVMEKAFHAMWWDYSNRRFNIKGRVYLKGLVLFGVGVVLIVKVIQPLVVKLTDAIPPKALYITCFILYSIIIIDLATTIVDLKGLIKVLKDFQNTMLSRTQKGIDLTGEQFDEAKEMFKSSEIYKNTFGESSRLERIKNRYPNFTLKKYKYILDLINDPPIEEKARDDIKLYGNDNHIDEEGEA